MGTSTSRKYNPGWLTDDDLLASFVARQQDFIFLRDELSHASLQGSVQHYLLVGVRGAGKTTLLKRLAIAIRREDDLNDHLIALSFPEELYQVKNLSDFWWAACDALADELDRLERITEANQLSDTVDQLRLSNGKDNPASDAGFKLLLQTCGQLKRRPVLLVDNLDMVFERIDKTGRKLIDPHAAAYWALREALSTVNSPIMIGGSVRLSAAFTGYDRAFYDFFLPKRLGKLTLNEVREVLQRLAEIHNTPEVKSRLQARPGRVEALFELTGGNPRALSLIFDLLRNGPNSRAVEDFDGLMDSTTPYYKARIEDLSEQAQVIMHTLAVLVGDGLRFGQTAAEIGNRAGLVTTTVSAQLTILENEGLVEKSTDHGRAQYRIAEQLFRLWLQMRGTRRIRQNVIGLTKFFEAVYDPEELQNFTESFGVSALAEAKYAFALAGTNTATTTQRNLLEAYGTERLHEHLAKNGGKIDEYLPISDHADSQISSYGNDQHLSQSAKNLRSEGNIAYENGDWSKAEICYRNAIRVSDVDFLSWINLGMLLANKLTRYEEAETAFNKACELAPADTRPWFHLGNLLCKKLNRFDDAEVAYCKAIELDSSIARLWSALGNLLSKQPKRHSEAEAAYRKAIELDSNRAQPWNGLGLLLSKQPARYSEAELAYRKALEIDPDLSISWNYLGDLLATKLDRFIEAEAAYHKAIQIDESTPLPWNDLGNLLSKKPERYEEAESAYHKAIELNSNNSRFWINLGRLLSQQSDRYTDAEAAYRKAIDLDPDVVSTWNYLGDLLSKQVERYDEAEATYHKAIEMDLTNPWPWNDLGDLLAKQPKRHGEVEPAYRKAIELDPTMAWAWINLAVFLSRYTENYTEAEDAYNKAIELEPMEEWTWVNFGFFLSEQPNRHREAESAYRKAIEIEPNNYWGWLHLGNLLKEETSRQAEAEIAYRNVIKINPDEAWLWCNFGDFLSENIENYSEAESAYRKAIELESSYSRGWVSLGNLFSNKLNRYDDAEIAYKKALDITPENADVWGTFGLFLSNKTDRHDEAEIAIRQAIMLAPDNAWFWGMLGALLTEKLPRFGEAEVAYRKAIELRPTSHWPRMLFALLMMKKLNRFEEAEDALKTAVQVAPDSASVWMHLGIAQDHLQRNEDALNSYNKAIELDKNLENSLQSALLRLKTRVNVGNALQSIENGNQQLLKENLSRFLVDSENVATILVSKEFIENFLFHVVANIAQAETVLNLMRDLGYEKHARPLILAFEAAIRNQEEMLSELEPEIRGATKLMFNRLKKVNEE